MKNNDLGFIHNYIESFVCLTHLEAEAVLKHLLNGLNVEDIDEIKLINIFTRALLSRNVCTSMIERVNKRTTQLINLYNLSTEKIY